MLPEYEIIDEVVNEAEEFRYSITSYGADYTVDSIAKRIEQQKIFVPPFQRKYVWTHIQASRFIESLILGLPVPGVFLSKEESTGKLLIIDGQQRMLSIANFYKGVFKDKKFTLKGVQSDLEGKSYEDLNQIDQNRLDDSIIHSTIVKQDAPSEDNSSIYMIFERLNTGGTPLQPQEIRACVYYGAFNELLTKLTENASWRAIFGAPHKRMKEEELILRFYSLFYEYDNYKSSLKSFLNSYMARNRNFQLHAKSDLEALFHETIDTIYNALGDGAFRSGSGRINAAIFDSVMIGVAKAVMEKGNSNLLNLKKHYENLISQPEYLECVDSRTSSQSSVQGRIRKSIEIFREV